MARNFLMTRRNWVQEPGAYFYGAGAWYDLLNILDPRPQVVAEAPDNMDWSATQFSMDLGAVRKVGLIYLINLRVSPLAIIEVTTSWDSTFATANTFHIIASGWPPDEAEPFEPNAWGELGLTHVYLPDEQAALGYPRMFVPPAVVDCRYIRVQIRDSTNVNPIQVGCFGVSEVWEAPINFDFGWSVTPLDDSDVQRVAWGTSSVTKRGQRRRLNVGFQALDENDFWVRPFGVMMRKGQSEPVVAAPLPEYAPRLEKSAVYGLINNDPQMSNPFFGYWALPFQVEQEI